MSFILELEELLKTRKAELPEGSYTSKMFAGPPKQLLKKIVEEAGEATLALAALKSPILTQAAVSPDPANGQPAEEEGGSVGNGVRSDAIDEAGDLVFHLLLGLVQYDISWAEVVQRLEDRHKK